VCHLNIGGTLDAMPTTRPRHQITETPAVAYAIDVAAQRWPGEPRGKLLLRLVTTGAATLEGSRDAEIERRRAVIEETSGKYAAAFPPGYLADLRRDWPD